MLSVSSIKAAKSKARASYYAAEYSSPGVLVGGDGGGSVGVGGGVVVEGGVELPGLEGGVVSEGVELARERSVWWGEGARLRGLEGVVEESDLVAVLEGRDPVTGQFMCDPSVGQLRSLSRRCGLDDRLLDREELLLVRRGVHPLLGGVLSGGAKEYADGLFGRGSRAGSLEVTGVDLTFSAPKSVSLMVGTGDEELRRVAGECHALAVSRALEFFESDVACVRRGKGGVDREAASGLLGALVTQLSSRDDDPSLHTHCVLSAVGCGEDGRFSALDSSLVFGGSKVIGSVYQAELRHLLSERLGVAWEVRGNGLGEVVGVPGEVLRSFSRRSVAIEARLGELEGLDRELVNEVMLDRELYRGAWVRVQSDLLGCSDRDVLLARRWERFLSVVGGSGGVGRAKLVAQLTRAGKLERSELDLREEWGERWGRDGCDWDEVLGESVAVREEELVLGEGVVGSRDWFFGVLEEELVGGDSVFDRRDAVLAGLRVADPSMGAGEVLGLVDEFLDSRAVEVREDFSKRGSWVRGGGGLFTTGAVIEQERRIRRVAGEMLDRDDCGVAGLDVVGRVAAEYTLNDEQEGLLAALTVSGRQLVVSRGIAGSGKTHVLGSAASVLRSEGYQVVGLATAAATAQRLAAESGFDRSSSIDKFLSLASVGRWERGLPAELLAEREVLKGEERQMRVRHDRELLECEERGGDVVALREAHVVERREWEDGVWGAWLAKARGVVEERESFESRLGVLSDRIEDVQFRLDSLGDVELLDAGGRDVYEGLVAEREGLVREFRELRSVFKEGMSSTEEINGGEKVCVVVDEAGMVASEHYDALLGLCRERGWKIAFVGDDRQLQEVQRGGAFRMLSEMGGCVELGTARRARAQWEKDVQTLWWGSDDEGSVRRVAQAYVDHGRVSVVDDRLVNTEIAVGRVDPNEDADVRRVAGRLLMRDKWLEAREDGVDALLMASTREDVFELNRLVQDELVASGEVDVSGASVEVVDVRGEGKRSSLNRSYRMWKGDRVLVTKNIAGTDVKNGMGGVIVGVSEESGSVRVSLPTGPEGTMRQHVLTAEQLGEGVLALGYATTAHKAQGASVERGFVLADSSMDREKLYPSLTRGKGWNEVVWLGDGGDVVDELASSMLRSSKKVTALSLVGGGPTEWDVDRVVEEFAARGVDVSREDARDVALGRLRAEYLREREARVGRERGRVEAAERVASAARGLSRERSL